MDFGRLHISRWSLLPFAVLQHCGAAIEAADRDECRAHADCGASHWCDSAFKCIECAIWNKDDPVASFDGAPPESCSALPSGRPPSQPPLLPNLGHFVMPTTDRESLDAATQSSPATSNALLYSGMICALLGFFVLLSVLEMRRKRILASMPAMQAELSEVREDSSSASWRSYTARTKAGERCHHAVEEDGCHDDDSNDGENGRPALEGRRGQHRQGQPTSMTYDDDEEIEAEQEPSPAVLRLLHTMSMTKSMASGRPTATHHEKQGVEEDGGEEQEDEAIDELEEPSPAVMRVLQRIQAKQQQGAGSRAGAASGGSAQAAGRVMALGTHSSGRGQGWGRIPGGDADTGTGHPANPGSRSRGVVDWD